MRARLFVPMFAAVLAVTLFIAANDNTGTTSSTLIEDQFDEGKRTALQDHTPNTDTVGGGWDVELGDWTVHKGKTTESSDVPVFPSSDYRATIHAGTDDVSVEVTVKMFMDGDQFWGAVARHNSATDWIMAFHDGVGDIVLGKKVTGEDEIGNPAGYAGFQELARVPRDWKPGKKAKTHVITLEVIGNSVNVYADGELAISRSGVLDDLTSGEVGIFSRGVGKNQFLNFLVEQAGA